MCTAVVQALIMSVWLGGLDQASFLQETKQREHALCLVMTRCLHLGNENARVPTTWLYKKFRGKKISKCYKTTRTKKNWLGQPVKGAKDDQG